MFKVIKNKGKEVTAYCLGEKEDSVVKKLREEGKIVEQNSGVFEIFSRESVNGKGQIAYTGDFVKIDSSGYPYPNERQYFLNNHKYLSENKYEQIPKPLDAWNLDEDMCDEVEFLKCEKGLTIDETDEEKCFTAPLWGSILSAPKDAVIVFYEINREENGEIKDIEFNFVQRDEFEKIYSLVKEEK